MHLINPIRKGKNNLKNYFFLFLLLLLFVSCEKNKPSLAHPDFPADSIIPRSQMVKMLADIHVLEAALQAIKRKGPDEQQMAFFYYSRFFSEYHMSGKRFRTNLDNYQAETEQFYLLYNDVIKELDKRIRLRKLGNSKLK